MSGINPRVDIAFKKIFGTEENKDLLISLINSIVSEEDHVAQVTLLNPYNQKAFKKQKLSILDIKAEGHDGKKFNIEIQISDEADYDKRALFYWAKLYAQQLESGEDYSKLNKVIGIHILNFTSIPKTKRYHSAFQLRDKIDAVTYFEDIELHTIELKKFTDSLGKESGKLLSKLKNMLDMWSAFLTKHDLLDLEKIEENLGLKEIKKAINVLNIMNFTEEERQAYEDRLKWLRIEANSLKKAEEKGWKAGKAEGLKKGKEEGEERALSPEDFVKLKGEEVSLM